MTWSENYTTQTGHIYQLQREDHEALCLIKTDNMLLFTYSHFLKRTENFWKMFPQNRYMYLSTAFVGPAC